MTCRHCGSRLDAAGRCPGDTPLLRVLGRDWGTRAQLSHHLGRDITRAMLNNYRQRDGLETYRVGRNVYHPYDQTAAIERAKRLAKEETGKGRPRRLDVGWTVAA